MNGANHERFASLLWADGYAVGDGTAQDLGHGIRVFGRVEFWPGVLGILFQQALALEAATYPARKDIRFTDARMHGFAERQYAKWWRP
jgi:hypothetical protein